MGKVFVHIGLPKTATSTLQTDVFPALQDDKLKYLGVDGLRREGASSAIYDQFMDAVENGNGIDTVQNALRENLKVSDLLLSEEMLTLSSENLPWQSKLDRVGEILSGLDYIIIISVREPVSAMFSYYVERYPRLSNIPFVECAISHNDMLIYHYGKLLQTLSQIFETDRLFFVRFEDIISSNIEHLIELLVGNRKCMEISYGIHNRRTTKGGRVVSQYKVSPYTLVAAVYRKLGLKRFRMIGKFAGYAKTHLKVLDQLAFKTVKVSRPTAHDIEFIKDQLLEDRIALTSRFGIRYE